MNPQTIFHQKMADAAMEAIENHWKAGIGMRPVSMWDNRDVIDSGLILGALAEYGIDPTEQNEAHLENIVSPLVFRSWHSRVGGDQSRLNHALAMLHVGGVGTFGLNRLQQKYAQQDVQEEAKPSLGMRFRQFLTFSRV